ncbi:unnamed protein product [Colias eurytheme]|nr:unnamed protein product [Colias eurytheme]
MAASRITKELGTQHQRLWISRSLYYSPLFQIPFNNTNKYYLVRTYKSDNDRESSVGEITPLDSKPSELFPVSVMCLGNKSIAPIDNTRCGFDVASVFARSSKSPASKNKGA